MYSSVIHHLSMHCVPTNQTDMFFHRHIFRVLKIIILIFKEFTYLFLESGEKGRETAMCGCLSCAPYWGPGLQPRHVPLTGNRTCDPLVRRPVLSPLSHTSQGKIIFKF